MMLRGIRPPRLGTPQSVIMTRMFVMEQTQQYEVMSTVGMLLMAVSGANQNAQNNVKRVLENFRDSLGYGRWSTEKRESSVKKEKTDSDLLAHMDRMLGKGPK